MRALGFLTVHLPALAWTGFCTWLLLMPGSDLRGHAETAERFEELGHAVLIFALAWLWARSFRRLAPAVRGAGLWALAGALAYAVALEVAQRWIPGRGFEWLDIATSVVGALAAAELPGVLGPTRR